MEFGEESLHKFEPVEGYSAGNIEVVCGFVLVVGWSVDFAEVPEVQLWIIFDAFDQDLL